MKKDSKTYQNVMSQREKIAQSFIDAIDRGGLNWVQKWEPVNVPIQMMFPVNASTGKGYTGRNTIILAAAAGFYGFNDPRWVTFAQAKKMGWNVRKGEHSPAYVEHFSPRTWSEDTTNDNGETETVTHSYIALDGAYAVFNAEQIDGIPAYEGHISEKKEITDPNSAIWTDADNLIASSRCEVRERNQNEAFYAPLLDYIQLPTRAQFSTPLNFLGTLAHEMTHSTGSVFNRDTLNKYGTKKYAFEELVAELGSAFVLESMGYEAQALDPHDQNFESHAAYLASWKKRVSEDPDAIMKAAGLASDAASYIIKRYRNQIAGAPIL